MNKSDKTKECPGCAMDVPEGSDECPICGHVFPRSSKTIQIMAWILIFLLLIWYFF